MYAHTKLEGKLAEAMQKRKNLTGQTYSAILRQALAESFGLVE